jgi:hypothetical protein
MSDNVKCSGFVQAQSTQHFASNLRKTSLKNHLSFPRMKQDTFPGRQNENNVYMQKIL